MRTLLLLVILFAGITQLPAQNRFRKTTLYTEIAGNGITLSINYERQLQNKPGLGLFAGIALGGDDLPIIPFGAKYLFPLANPKSFLEAGAGVALTEASSLRKPGSFLDNSGVKAAFIPSFGYRHHTDYGLMWRLNYTPLFSSGRDIPYLFGFSLGWRL